MGRIRTIKPEFHEHEELSALPAETHLLAAALTNYADDFGYFNANPLLVKAGTNPLRNDKTKIEDQLAQLESVGYIVIRRKGLKAVGKITTFEKHQRVSHPSPSKLVDKFEALAKNSGEPPETLVPEQGTGNREVEREKERKALVERVFVFFCSAVGKDASRYTLTDERRKKALLRVAERSAIHAGDMAAVESELIQAVKNLAASDFHQSKGYLDWTEQIFRSEEEFQKRLNWQRPLEMSNGKFAGKTESSVNAASEAMRIISERAEAARNREGTDEAGHTPAGEVGYCGLLGSG